MTNKEFFKNAYMLNRDPDWCLYVTSESKEACEAQLIHNFSSFVNGTEITDVMFNTFCSQSYIPSFVFDWFPMRWIQYKDYDYKTGEKVTEIPFQIARWETFYKCYTEFNIDPVQIFLDQMKKYNKRAWLSIRMNDAHVDPYNGPKMQQEDIAAGQTIGDAYGYYSRCRDFSYGRYRTLLLAYIEEVFSKYDFFGLELDFMREVYCFDYKNNPDCHKIMTEYLREVKALTLKIAKKLGHEIKILIRLPRDIKSALGFGFDVKAMIDEGLVDVINPTPRWAYTDSSIPLDEWYEAAGDKVAIVPGIETLNRGLHFNTFENVKAYMASFYGQGACGGYLYNFFQQTENCYKIWRINRENCLEGYREFIVTDQEAETSPYQAERFKVYPFAVDGTAILPVELGKIKATDNVTVTIDFEGDVMPTLTVGGKENVVGTKVEPVMRQIASRPDFVNLTEHNPLCFDISGVETPSHLDLTFNGNGTIHFVKIDIDAK